MGTQFNGVPANIDATLPASKNISSSTNASPIEVTTSAAHGYETGDMVIVRGHQTNTAANGEWSIIVTSSTKFTLTGSTGNGVGGATGTVINQGFGTTYTIPSDGDDFDAAAFNVAFEALGDRTAWLCKEVRFHRYTDIFIASDDQAGVQLEAFTTTTFTDASSVTVDATNLIIGDQLYATLTCCTLVSASGADNTSELRLVAVDDVSGTPTSALVIDGARCVFGSGASTAGQPRSSSALAGFHSVTRSGSTRIKLQGKANGAGGTNIFLYDAWFLRVEVFR